MTEKAFENIWNALNEKGRVPDYLDHDHARAVCPIDGDGTQNLGLFDTATRVNFYCDTGQCSPSEILQAIDLSLGDRYDRLPVSYRYEDNDGTVTRVVKRALDRQGDKHITQSVEDKTRVILYRLPQVLEAVAAGEVIYLVEGEEDVHALEVTGQTATTAPQGGANFHLVDATPLTGARVIAVVDKDKTGDEWARKVAASLEGVTAELVFKQAGKGKDVSDHLAAGLSLEQLNSYELKPDPKQPRLDLHQGTPKLAGQQVLNLTTRPADANQRVTAWVARKYEESLNEIRQLAPGERNNELNSIGYSLARLAAGGLIDEQELRSDLEEAGLAAGLPLSEVRSTVDSAIEAGRKSPRTAQDVAANLTNRPPVASFDSRTGEITTPIATSFNTFNTFNTHIKGESDENSEERGRAILLGRLRTAAQLQDEEFPPIQWQVPGILSEGYGLLVGASKIGKSWLCLSLAAAIASGTRALGCVATGEPRPVLYLSLEDDGRSLQNRLTMLLGDGTKWPGLLQYPADRIPANEVPLTARIWLEEHQDSRPVVIIDTLGRILPEKKAGQSAYQFDYQIGIALKALSDEHPGSTLLVVHHDRKMKTGDWMESISGTNGINGAADFTLYLTRARGEQQGALHLTGRTAPEASYALIFDPDCCEWTLDGQGLEAARERHRQIQNDHEQALATQNHSDRSKQALKFVNSQGSVTPKQLADHLGIKPNAAGAILGRLATQNLIDKAGRGYYTPLQHSVESVESVENRETGNTAMHTCFDCRTPIPKEFRRCQACATRLAEKENRQPPTLIDVSTIEESKADE